MPANPVAQRQNQIDQQVLAQLAVLGGKHTKDDEITFNGKAFVFPEQYRGDLPGIQKFITRYIESQMEETYVVKTFDYRPMDGAHATYQMLKQYFGYAQTKAKQGMFGKTPPSEINIAIGYVDGKLQHMNVPWGDMVLPYVGGVMSMDTEHTSDRGTLFQLRTRVRKVFKDEIEGFYKAVEQYLQEHSIYRGHAVNGDMEFFDTDRVDPSQFVYTQQVWRDAETHIFSPMRDRLILDAQGFDPKRVVLLEGPFGTGKSGLGRIAAKVAVGNGWTPIFCRPGEDDPFQVMQTARLYLPIEGRDTGGCLVFMEDIDVISANKRDPLYTSKLLDAFDGFETKGRPFVLIMTTNHADEITQGMTRPGRIHAIISIGAMDRPGVEQLCWTVIGDHLAPDVDFDAVYEATADYMPAFVREGIERSLRYTISRTHAVGKIATIDLVEAMNSLRPQFNLHMAAIDRPDRLPAIDELLRQAISEESSIDPRDITNAVSEIVEDKLNNTVMHDSEGDYMGNLSV
jgi:ATPase family associated with various cellular activities (AAA)